MNASKMYLVVCSMFVFSFQVSAQSASGDAIQHADSLVKMKEYKTAEKMYLEIIHSEPGNTAVIFKLASLYYTEGKYDAASDYYLKLVPNKNPTVLYNLACLYSLRGNTDSSLSFLHEAVQNGFTQLAQLKKDPDLANVRSEKKFDEIARSIKALGNFPESDKFNFWVGEWDVYDLQNRKAGTSSIEKILSGAVILENWTGASGYIGKSFNHYNMDKKKWIEYWVDMNSVGDLFEGNYDSTQKAIVFYSNDHMKDPAPYLRRLTFFDLGPDTVRQFAQRSTDEGTTWSTEYDLKYIRKGSAK
jgi:tetratricopeptide (TPR) repeat protein